MLLLTKIFDFCASHRLYREDWDLQKNLAVFGKCANPNGHGHNYRLHVSVGGNINPETNMILDASLLSAIVEESVINDLDHKNLNLDVPWLNNILPSVEGVIEKIWQRLAPAISAAEPNAELVELRLEETRRIYAIRRKE